MTGFLVFLVTYIVAALLMWYGYLLGKSSRD